jgi:phytoene dehydrogenase-like protein
MDDFPADVIIANLTPPNLQNILANSSFDRQIELAAPPEDGWGAFMVYAGLDASILPPDTLLHHQILRGRPLGEGNSIFISFSPEWDPSRAPSGHRSATISTHTRLSPWWQTIAKDKASYNERKNRFTEKVLDTAETIFPGFRQGIKLIISGTPVTFQRFTGRVDGWVGGFPQTSLFRSQGPRVAPGLWMVGDSVFPGQSTAAVAISGLRVANLILRDVKYKPHLIPSKSSEPSIRSIHSDI